MIVDNPEPIKVGYLKCDLYEFRNRYTGYSGIHFHESYGNHYHKTKVEAEALIIQFSKCLEQVAEKGDIFYCFIYDSVECWFSEDNNIGEQGDIFAEKFLENIEEC